MKNSDTLNGSSHVSKSQNYATFGNNSLQPSTSSGTSDSISKRTPEDDVIRLRYQSANIKQRLKAYNRAKKYKFRFGNLG